MFDVSFNTSHETINVVSRILYCVGFTSLEIVIVSGHV